MIPSDEHVIVAYTNAKSTVDRIAAEPAEFARFAQFLGEEVPVERRHQVIHRLLTLRKRGKLPALHRPRTGS